MLIASIGERVTRLVEAERPIQLLPVTQVLELALAATRFYVGFADLGAWQREAEAWLPVPPAVEAGTCLDESEWALIRPLLLLYVERETAFQLEASRGLGVEVFGRSTSEIAGEIAAYEAELPKRAFSQPFIFLV